MKQAQLRSFKVKDIHPNPFRHIERYPLRETKLEELRQSFDNTGFWNNILGREVDGRAEIAYGHHRLAVLKENVSPETEIGIMVRDLSDTEMILIMHAENQEEYGRSDFAVLIGDIRSLVEAYADGKIELEEVPKGALPEARWAPSFVVGGRLVGKPAAPYTSVSVAKFLGETFTKGGAPPDKIIDALRALELIEEGLLEDDDFRGLNQSQAAVLVEETRRVKQEEEAEAEMHRKEAEDAKRAEEKATEEEERREAEKQRKAAERKATAATARAKKQAGATGKKLSKRMKEGKGASDTKKESRQERPPRRKSKQTTTPHLDDASKKLAARLDKILNPKFESGDLEMLEKVIEFGDHPDYSSKRKADLVAVLRGIGCRSTEFAERLERAGVKQLTEGGK